MTFCIAIKVRDGVVALADTMIVRGSEQSTKEKLSELRFQGQSLFTMTSGLRSVRDKAIRYLDAGLNSKEANKIDQLYQIANLYGEQLRRVKGEDGDALQSTNHKFNSHGIIGGQLAADPEPQLFYIYPEGNWVEATVDSPYFTIGRTYYSKPLLDRLLSYESSLQSAIALAFLAFNDTQSSVTDVGFPVDLAVYDAETGQSSFRRFEKVELAETADYWADALQISLEAMPLPWAEPLLKR